MNEKMLVDDSKGRWKSVLWLILLMVIVVLVAIPGFMNIADAARNTDVSHVFEMPTSTPTTPPWSLSDCDTRLVLGKVPYNQLWYDGYTLWEVDVVGIPASKVSVLAMADFVGHAPENLCLEHPRVNLGNTFNPWAEEK